MTLCECGCGQKTTVYQGKSRRFIHGHYGKPHMWTEKRKKIQADMSRGNLYCLGYKQTEEHKRKIGKGNKGKTQSDSAKQRIALANKGKSVSEDTKKKITGENHYNWQGGVSFGKYCPKFNNTIKESVRDKFGRVCLLCGKTEAANGRKLDVHHIDYNKEQGCDGHKWKLIPLCMRCHIKTNYNRNYWEALIQNKLAIYLNY